MFTWYWCTEKKQKPTQPNSSIYNSKLLNKNTSMNALYKIINKVGIGQ